MDGEEDGCDEEEEEVGGAGPTLSLSLFLSQGSEESLDDESQAPEPCSLQPGAHNGIDHQQY